MRLTIRDIEYSLPERVVTNEELHRANPSWDMKNVELRTGVLTRHIAGTNETALDLAYSACLKLFSKHPELSSNVDALIFCTQSEDHIMPPNCCLLHRRLGLHDKVFAFDFNLACSGFVYGLALAQGLVSARIARNILFVTGDTYSKFINPGDRSATVLFGDGAAVTWLAPGGSDSGLIDIECATYGKGADTFIIPAGGCRQPKSVLTAAVNVDRSGNIRSSEDIHMNGMEVLNFVKTKVPQQVLALLSRNSLGMQDLDLILFHQASQVALDSLAQVLDISPVQTFSNLKQVGNTVSASLPILLKDAIDTGRAKPGDKIALVAFGVGLSYGSCLLHLPADLGY